MTASEQPGDLWCGAHSRGLGWTGWTGWTGWALVTVAIRRTAGWMGRWLAQEPTVADSQTVDVFQRRKALMDTLEVQL